MALDFPNAPADGDEHYDAGSTVTYKYQASTNSWEPKSIFPEATDAEVAAGVNSVKFLTPRRFMTWLTTYLFSKKFDSIGAGTGILHTSAAQTFSFTHGLGGVPKQWAFYAECVVNDGTFSVGDFITIAGLNGNIVGNCTETVTATQCKIKSHAYGIQANDWNGAGFGLSAASKWKIHCVAVR